MGELVDYILSFAPWIGYVVLTRAANSWGDGYTLGLGMAFALVVWRTIRRDSRFIDIGTLCFCSVMTAVSVLDPTSPLRPYNLPLSMAAVAALSELHSRWARRSPSGSHAATSTTISSTTRTDSRPFTEHMSRPPRGGPGRRSSPRAAVLCA